jgi:tRNA-splicing ligase RtcB
MVPAGSSRGKAKEVVGYDRLQRELHDAGIEVRAASAKGLIEEAPETYKSVEEVGRRGRRAGLAAKVARLRARLPSSKADPLYQKDGRARHATLPVQELARGTGTRHCEDLSEVHPSDASVVLPRQASSLRGCAKLLKSGAPDRIRTCDLCLRRAGDVITAIA